MEQSDNKTAIRTKVVHADNVLIYVSHAKVLHRAFTGLIFTKCSKKVLRDLNILKLEADDVSESLQLYPISSKNEVT